MENLALNLKCSGTSIVCPFPLQNPTSADEEVVGAICPKDKFRLQVSFLATIGSYCSPQIVATEQPDVVKLKTQSTTLADGRTCCDTLRTARIDVRPLLIKPGLRTILYKRAP